MIDDRRPLPESVNALVVIAAASYRRRLRLYVGAAVAGLLVQALIAFVRPNDVGFATAGSVVVDAFITALVTIGVIADLREGEPVADRELAALALSRWGIVAGVTAVVDFITLYTQPEVVGSPAETAYGFLILPIVVLWGSIGFASVIAAIDDKTSPVVLVLASIGRSMALAFARQNIGRLTALALVAVLPAFVETVLAHQLEVRKVVAWQFLASIPIDALVTGPLQAVFTVFYLDFVRRSAGAAN